MKIAVQASKKMKEYVSTLDFNLNFEDHKNSVRVKKGESVFYDGETALYKKEDNEVAGKTTALQRAIDKTYWLVPKSKKAVIEEKTDINQPKNTQYDDFKGGNFDEFVKRTNMGIIREEDLTVKNRN